MDQTNSESIVNDLRVRVAALEDNTKIDRLQRENAELQGHVREWIKQNAPGGWINGLRVKLARAEAALDRVALAVAALPMLPAKPFGEYEAGLFTNCQKIIAAIDGAKTEARA